MPTISHRELRNSSADVLRRVAAGETFEITNHGVVAAVLIPPPATAMDRLRAAGRVHVATDGGTVDLRAIARGTSTASSAEVVDDVRGGW